MSDTVLVTGGAGFIGSAVVTALRANGRNVISVGRKDGDITVPGTLDRHQSGGIDSVVHCAGRSFVPESWRDPAGFITDNVLGTTQVLEFCRATGARLIHISAYIYGRPDSLPIREDAPVRPNNPYALSKHLAEQVCGFYAAQHGVPVSILRPFNIYGPGQPEQFLIPTILSQLRGSRVELMDLAPRRDHLYLDDLVDVILRAEARTFQDCTILNIGSGISRSVTEIVAEAQAVAGTRLPVVSREISRNNEIADVVADITAAAKVLGWTPRTNLRQGLERCWRAGPAGHYGAGTDSAMMAEPQPNTRRK